MTPRKPKASATPGRSARAAEKKTLSAPPPATPEGSGDGATVAPEPAELHGRDLLAQLPVACYTLDAAGRITFFNAAAEKLWGRAPVIGEESWCGAQAMAALDGTPLPLDQGPAAIALRERRPVRDVEAFVIRPDGSRRRVIPQPDPIFDAAGNLSGVVSVLVDVTEQRETAQALQRNDERLRQRALRMQLVSETLGQLINASDPEAVVRELFPKVAANLGADTYFNYLVNATGTRLELRAASGVPEKARLEVARIEFGQGIVGAVAATRQPITLTDIAHSKDPRANLARRLGLQAYTCHPLIVGGSLLGTLSFASHTRPAFDEDEMEFMRLVAQSTAVALDQLRTATARQQLAAIVESSDDAIVGKRLDGTITSWNQSAERLFGYSADEMIGESILRLIPPDRHAEETGIINRIRAGERIEHYETIRRRKDGSALNVSLTVSPVKDATGRIIGASKIARDITRQRVAQESVRESEERLRQGLAAANMGSWRVDLVTGIRTRDANLNSILGLPAAETRRPFEDGPQLIHPDDRATALAAWERALAEAGIYEAEFRVQRADGTIRWLREQGRALSGNDGKPAVVTGVTIDITERKRTEAELRRRTHTLEILNRVGSALVAGRDLEKMVQAVTDAGCEISGAAFGAFFYNVKNERGESYTLYTVSGVPREAFAKFPMPRNTEVFAPTFAGEGVVRVDDILADPRYGKNAPHFGMPKGHLPVRSYLAVPVKTHGGEVLGGLFFGHPEAGRFTQDSEDVLVAIAAQAAIAIDNAKLNTALQRELDQQRLTEAALRESAAQLRLVTDNAPVLIAQFDRERRFKFVNRLYATRYQREAQDFIGRNLADIVGAPAYAWLHLKIDAVLAGQPQEFEMEIEYPMAHLGKRWCHVTYTPERAADGRVVGFLAVLADITTRKQTERELEQARDKALAASGAKDEFLAALSHELRTPLNPVLLLASDAAANPSLPADVRADFDSIRKNVDLEARLIDDLLDITRITRGKLPLEMRTINLHHALQDALAIVRPELEAKRLVLDLAFGAPEPTVWGDEVRLQQVFWNVLKNAVKFTPDSGRITVQTELEPKQGVILVKIIDTGIGMTPEEQAHIFESFTQGDHATKTGSHRFGGLGLGLAISRMLVEMHSGHIRATSRGRSHGSEFIIDLPLHHASARREGSGPAWPLTSAPLVPPAKAAPGKRVRLLLVEDHAPTRNTLAQLLSRRHYEVLAAGSVAEARALAASGDFQLVISDIGLPDGDGYELMTELRTLRPSLSGIALSGYGMEEDVARSRQVGFAQHLIKPVHITALEAAIALILSPAVETAAAKS